MHVLGATVKLDEFTKVMSGRQLNIQSQLHSILATRISENRPKLKSIVETIVLCGQQNIPLRGHRDSTLDLERDEAANSGNFWALLHFRAAACDSILHYHLAHAP